MPQQSIYLDEQTSTKRVQVLKVYDPSFARACFNEMEEDALTFLSRSLNLEGDYEAASEVGWEDIEDEAREDGNLMSFFVVIEQTPERERALYVSPDWSSAEAFARRQL